jgi:uncharacterized membrane protein YdjX (TVP38/TMEM64 family)
MRVRLSRTLLLGLALALLVIVPFVLFGDRIEAWAHALLLDRRPQGLLPRVVCVVLLVSDVLLPVPSSLVSTAAGLWWGWLQGTLLSTLGMQLGSWFGFWLGLNATALRRWVGEDEAARLHRWFARHGEWVVVTLRPVPVLAEASAVFAGFSRMDPVRFSLLSLAANLCVSLFYAAAGAWLGRSAPGAGLVLLLVALVVIAAFGIVARRMVVNDRAT